LLGKKHFGVHPNHLHIKDAFTVGGLLTFETADNTHELSE